MNDQEYELIVLRHFEIVRDMEWSRLVTRLRSLAPGRLLEIGCRHDRWLRRSRELGFQAIGLDPDPYPAHADAPTVIKGIAEDIPLPDDSQDVVLISNAIYCFGDRPRALSEVARVLRADGRLFVLTSNGVAAAVRLCSKYLLESPRLFLRGLCRLEWEIIRNSLIPPSMTPDCSTAWDELTGWRVCRWAGLLEPLFEIKQCLPTAFFSFPDYRLFIPPVRLGRFSSSVIFECSPRQTGSRAAPR